MNETPQHQIVFKQYQTSFDQLLKVFLETNAQINLSAIRDEKGIITKHFLDSLLPCDFWDFSNSKILDIGSGGGFPALPLAITHHNSTVHALDSVGKKMKAVSQMAQSIGLNNLTTFHGRIEEYGQNPKFREQYDIVTARALAPWPVLLEYAMPFVKVGGTFVAYQGPAIEEGLELNKNLEQRYGGYQTLVIQKDLEDQTRLFVLIEKDEKTSKKYPRMNGIPRQEPLT